MGDGAVQAAGEEQVVFGHTLEGLFKRAIAEKLTPSFTQRLLSVGVDVNKPFDTAYARKQWVEVLKICAEELYPSLAQDEAYFELGRTATLGYQKTLMGKALFAMLGLLGPERTLRRMRTNFRSANNYLDTRIERVDATTFDIWVNECNGNPGYLRGVLFIGLQFAGAKNPSVEPRDFDGHACTYRCRWQA